MPGSPDTNIALAGTKPPPSTLSNSFIPKVLLFNGASTVVKSPKIILRPLFAPRVFPFGPDASGASSFIEFHSPHDSHFPAHFL